MKPTIVIENEVFRKVMHWVHKSNMEVSGLGKVKLEDGGIIRVVDVMLLPQRVGSTHTDIETDDLNRAMYLLRETEGELKWWWHSHVDMGVFWSGTDMDTIKKLGAGGWFANSVFNKKREIRSATWVQQVQQVGLPWGGTTASSIFQDELETRVVDYRDPKADEWDAEYERNVKIGPPIPTNGYPQYNGVTQVKWENNKRYVKEGAEWVQRDWESSSVGESIRRSMRTTSATTDQSGTTRDYTVEPPVNRPGHMSKREFKHWKREYAKFKALEDVGHTVVQGLTETARSGEVQDELGFTQNERTLLMLEGWDDDDVEAAMIDQDLSPYEILELAKYGVSYQEVIYMLQQGWTMSGIINAADENPEVRRLQ